MRHGASIGANATIVCGIEIGRFAFIGAGALVRQDVKEYALIVGVPSVQIGWVSEYGERLDLPLYGSGNAICPVTGDRYELVDDRVVKAPGK